MTEFGENASAAVQIVQEGHNTFLTKAETTLEQAIEHVTALSHFATTPTAFSVNFDYTGNLAAFQRPTAPAIDRTDYDLRMPEIPGLPPSFVGEDVDVGELPVYDLQTPVIAIGPRPDRPDIARPIAPPRPPPLSFPGEPDYQSVIPDPVSLLSLNLPTFPSLVLPEFTSQRPALAPFDLGDVGSFTPEAYVSALLDKITGRVSTWMDGQEALPQAIVRALYERGRSRITIETQAAVEQAYDDYAARGFSAPSGLLDARVDGIRQAGQDRLADFSREVTIKEFDEALANMRLAVQQGLQLEGLTINLHMEEQRLLLQSAQFLRETSIAILNARIAQFNAEMQGYAIDAQVLEVRLRAELSKLEEVRLRLEGEKLKGDINELTIRQYAEQWNAVKSLADFYRTSVEAVKVQADANKIPIEIFAQECRAFETLWSAHAKEWDGYRAGIEGETSKAVLHRNLVEAFSARTQGVVQFGGLKLDRERLRIAQHGQELDVYGRALQRLDSLLGVERGRLSAVSQRDDALARIYSARATVEQAASAATDRSFQLGLEAARARVDTQLETARIKSNENIALQGLTLEALKALAQILSQLAASTMSAVNYSAGVSASDAFSHSRNVGWSGEAEDWNPSFV